MAMSFRAFRRGQEPPTPRASWSAPPVEREGPAASVWSRIDVRTCTRCGEHGAFRIDAAGTWAECTACGHLA